MVQDVAHGGDREAAVVRPSTHGGTHGGGTHGTGESPSSPSSASPKSRRSRAGTTATPSHESMLSRKPLEDVAARASDLDADTSAARLPGEDGLYRGVLGTASGDADQGLVGPGDGVCVRAVLMPQVYAFIRSRSKSEGARFRPLPVTHVSSPTGFSDVRERIGRGGGGSTPL